MSNQPASALALSVVPAPVTLLSYEQVMELECIRRRELFERISDGRYETVPSGLKARNGRPVMRVRLASLSAEAQARYLALLKDQASGISAPEPAHAASQIVARTERSRGAAVPMLADGSPDVHALIAAGRENEAEIYQQRLAAVTRYIAESSRCGHGEKGLILARIATEVETPPETLRNWLKWYRTSGLLGLVPGYGARRGLYAAIPAGLQKAILASHRNQQRQTVAQIMAHTVSPWCQAHRVMAPHARTVARFIQREVLRAETRAFRGGKRAWEEDIMVKVTRNPEDLNPNDLWCADHRRFDFFVLSPDGRVVRPWLTCYMDVCTADIVGWCISERPCSQTVALAMHHGIGLRGAPKVLYHDNGKEFIAKRFGGRPRSLQQVMNPADGDLLDLDRWPALPPAQIESVAGKALLAQYGIERIIFAIPYSSWSKPIESVFYAFHRQWENMMPGYCGNSPCHKPEKCRTEVREHRLLLWEQFVDIFSKHLDAWRSSHRCGTRSRTPDQAYQDAAGSIRTIPADALDVLLYRKQAVTVEDQGIQIGGVKFLDENLAYYVGERVEVLWNPDDLRHIICRPIRRPELRLVVAQIPNAQWFEQSEANRIVWSIRKRQREYLRAVTVTDRANLVPSAVDPDGANRLAQENAEARRAQIEMQYPAVADLAALKDVQASDEDDSKARESARKQAASSVAASILAQAQAEEAYKKGETA